MIVRFLIIFIGVSLIIFLFLVNKNILEKVGDKIATFIDKVIYDKK